MRGGGGGEKTVWNDSTRATPLPAQPRFEDSDPAPRTKCFVKSWNWATSLIETRSVSEGELPIA